MYYEDTRVRDSWGRWERKERIKEMSFISIPMLDNLSELFECSSFLSLQPSLAEGMDRRGSSSVVATGKERE